MPPLVRLALLVLATYLALCALAGAILGEGALRPARRAIDEKATTLAQELASLQHARLEPVSLRAPDLPSRLEQTEHTEQAERAEQTGGPGAGVTLRGWLFTPQSGNGEAVIVLHGVTDTRAGVRGIARLLLAAGYTVLTPDARAHGESGGTLATYGVLERQDIQAWARWLHARGIGGCVHGVGVSMGAAQLLQSLDGSPDAPCSAVAEASFASFREVAFDRLGQRVGAGPWLGRTLLRPVIEIGILIVRLRHGVNLAGASPAGALRATRTPVLLIHGTADRNIPPRHAQLLRDSNPAIATLWTVPGAGHAAALGADPAGYQERVLRFLAAHAAAPAQAQANASSGAR
jgi:pimeloyl-ACP methyl ester carboxylesterase